jgi:hypothetical protein
VLECGSQRGGDQNSLVVVNFREQVDVVGEA